MKINNKINLKHVYRFTQSAFLMSIAINAGAINGVDVPANSRIRANAPMINTHHESKTGSAGQSCSAVLLDASHIITALHCINQSDYKSNTNIKNNYSFKSTSIDVILPASINNLMFSNQLFNLEASFHLSSFKNDFRPNIRAVHYYSGTNIYIPNPNPNGHVPDLAIIELNQPVQYANQADFLGIHIPQYAINHDIISSNETKLTGWSYGIGVSSGQLRQSPLGTPRLENGEVVSQNLTCPGDSGGGVFFGEDVLLSIASYGESQNGLCYNEYHGVDVSLHSKWINSVLNGGTKPACAVDKQECHVGKIRPIN